MSDDADIPKPDDARRKSRRAGSAEDSTSPGTRDEAHGATLAAAFQILLTLPEDVLDERNDPPPQERDLEDRQ